METKDLYKLLERVAAGVVKALGEGWKVEPLGENGVNQHWRRLTKQMPDGSLYAINFNRIWNEPKLQFYGEYPKAPEGYNILDYIRTYNEVLPDCGVSEAKSPEQIAKDIQRRLFPLYEAKRIQALESIQNILTREKSLESSAKLLGDALMYPLRKPCSGDKVWQVRVNTVLNGRGYGDIEVTGDGESSTMHLRSIPIELAIELGKVLAAWTASHPTTGE